MDEMVDRLKDRTRKEIRYARGYQVMHRERYMEYLSDMRQARMRGDVDRQAEIAQDLTAFVGEMWHLMEMQRSAYQRLTGMAAGPSQPSAIGSDTTAPEGKERTKLIRLVLTRPEDG